MDDADALHQKIRLYRRYLAEGVDAALAMHYVQELLSAEIALQKLGLAPDDPMKPEGEDEEPA